MEKKEIQKLKKHKHTQQSLVQRERLEQRAVKGAEKAVREYRAIFERLASYDRT